MHSSNYDAFRGSPKALMFMETHFKLSLLPFGSYFFFFFFSPSPALPSERLKKSVPHYSSHFLVLLRKVFMLVSVNMSTFMPPGNMRIPRQTGGVFLLKAPLCVCAVPLTFTSGRLIQLRFKCDTSNLDYFTWIFPGGPAGFSHLPCLS